ncbi:YceI family protein [Amycolatopsis sp. CA-161197]|uniref:YceI family protein n=1 Tax=unclassified Amycolatopsis TaxID=2618356 RepID=UPI003456635A
MFGRKRNNGQRGGPVTFNAEAGLLSVRVGDEHGRPLPGTQMVMLHKRTQRQTKAVADEFGLAVSTLSAGTYAVTVSARGYQPRNSTVEVVSGDHTSLEDLRLVPDDNRQLPDPGEWVLDPDHTAIRFIARHIGLCEVHGRFRSFQGSIVVGKQIEDSTVEVVIDAASIDTSADKRDDHLRSPDFLDVRRFPQIRFHGHRFRRAPGDRWSIDGTLNLHGASRGVRLDAGYLGLRTWNGDRLGAVATTELHREDFTINWQQTLAKGLVMVGSTIEIQLDIQAVRAGTA